MFRQSGFVINRFRYDAFGEKPQILIRSRTLRGVCEGHMQKPTSARTRRSHEKRNVQPQGGSQWNDVEVLPFSHLRLHTCNCPNVAVCAYIDIECLFVGMVVKAAALAAHLAAGCPREETCSQVYDACTRTRSL
eukprot:2511508-Amphidinium_carterae.1